jgi:hypothetical protein
MTRKAAFFFPENGKNLRLVINILGVSVFVARIRKRNRKNRD